MNYLTGRMEKERAFYENMEQNLKSMPPVLTKYYLHLREEKKSYTTIKVYINNVMHFATFLNHGCVDNEFYKHVKTSDVEKYMIFSEAKTNGSGFETNSESVLQTRWSTLNNFFEWLLTQKCVVENPVIAVKRAKKKISGKEINLLSKSELRKIYATIYNSKKFDTVKSTRDMAIFHLSVIVGLKTSEISQLNIQDVDLANGEIHIKDSKHARIIEMCDEAIWALDEWHEMRSKKYGNTNIDALFISQKGNRISGDAMNDALLGYCMKAGIARNVTIKDFRSTAICQLLSDGVHVDRIAEYFGITTQEELVYFMQALEDTQKNIPEALNNLFDWGEDGIDFEKDNFDFLSGRISCKDGNKKDEPVLPPTQLSDLPNIGISLVKRLKAVGICTIEELMKAKTEDIWDSLYEISQYTDCVEIWSIEGAKRGVLYADLDEELKGQLKEYVRFKKGREKPNPEELTMLPNIGVGLAEKIKEIGISTSSELKAERTEVVWNKLYSAYPTVGIYDAYAIEGAKIGIKMKELDKTRKAELTHYVNDIKSKQ